VLSLRIAVWRWWAPALSAALSPFALMVGRQAGSLRRRLCRPCMCACRVGAVALPALALPWDHTLCRLVLPMPAQLAAGRWSPCALGHRAVGCLIAEFLVATRRSRTSGWKPAESWVVETPLSERSIRRTPQCLSALRVSRISFSSPPNFS